MFVIPTLASVVTLVLHVETGGSLDAQDAFAVVGLFNCLFMPLAVFPQAIRSLAEARVGVANLERLLAADNFMVPPPQPAASEAAVLVVRDGSFAWDGGASILTDIALRLMPGELVGICGAVGSGKSSLCAATSGACSA